MKKKKKTPLPPLGRGLEVKVKYKRGWYTLVSECKQGPPSWWAWSQLHGQQRPILTADITAAREKGTR
jgi:hypothetical protein